VIGKGGLLFDNLLSNHRLDLGVGEGADPVPAGAATASGHGIKPVRSGDDDAGDQGIERS
jgi:hypothetical protein